MPCFISFRFTITTTILFGHGLSIGLTREIGRATVGQPITRYPILGWPSSYEHVLLL